MLKKNLTLIVMSMFAVALFVGCSDNQNPMNANADALSNKLIGNGTPPIYGLANKAGLITLAAALEATGLNKTLNQDGPFTVFAPTEEAFAALPAGTLEALLADPDALTNILLYHVVEGKVMASDVVGLTSAPMLNGEDVSITVMGGGVMVNDANVIKTDIFAKNGVVHLIDNVLIPGN